MTSRPDTHRFYNGEKSKLQFLDSQYEIRLAGLRLIIAKAEVDAAVFTSMQSIAHYSGFLYCSFGRPYELVVTTNDHATISAGIDGGQPWRWSYGDNIT